MLLVDDYYCDISRKLDRTPIAGCKQGSFGQLNFFPLLPSYDSVNWQSQIARRDAVSLGVVERRGQGTDFLSGTAEVKY